MYEIFGHIAIFYALDTFIEICSGKLCGGIIIFRQCCPCGCNINMKLICVNCFDYLQLLVHMCE